MSQILNEQDDREAIAYGLWKSGVIVPQNKNDWKDLGPGPQTPFYKAADAVIAERRTRTAPGINEPEDLAAWADAHGLRDDWHEPDEQTVSARVVGDHLDNAMGYAITEDRGYQELVVILTVDGKDDARVNLATLLAWASSAHRKAA